MEKFESKWLLIIEDGLSGLSDVKIDSFENLWYAYFSENKIHDKHDKNYVKQFGRTSGYINGKKHRFFDLSRFDLEIVDPIVRELEMVEDKYKSTGYIITYREIHSQKFWVTNVKDSNAAINAVKNAIENDQVNLMTEYERSVEPDYWNWEPPTQKEIGE